MKKLDGIWSLEFYGLFGWENAGVLVLDAGRCFGGGNNHYSVGRYSGDGTKVEIEMERDYFGPVRTLFGAQDRRYSIRFEGKRKGKQIAGTATRPDVKVIPLQFRLKRRAALPGRS